MRVKEFKFVPGTFLEVQTFEVKPFTQLDVLAVYEALAHRRAATHSWVALQVPSHLVDDLEESVEGVVKVAASHGIGVVTFAVETDYTTWRILAEPERFQPDPEQLNDFIETQLPPVVQDKVLERLSQRIAQARDAQTLYVPAFARLSQELAPPSACFGGHGISRPRKSELAAGQQRNGGARCGAIEGEPSVEGSKIDV
nr:hypothetical protein [Rhodococcus sp. 06-418-1B]